MVNTKKKTAKSKNSSDKNAVELKKNKNKLTQLKKKYKALCLENDEMKDKIHALEIEIK